MPEINWYPGHMAKTRRMLADQLASVDAVIELCDARAPQATRNPDLNYLCRGKTRILILTKADLADDAVTSQWMAHYRDMGLKPIRFNSTGGHTRDILAAIEEACAPAVARMRERGVNKTARLMVIGIPNVGKSTFINRIFGRTIAQAGDKPGVTRSNQWVKVGPYLELLDTPGMLWPRLSDQGDARLLAYLGSIRDEILDSEGLAIDLIKLLYRLAPDAVCARFRITGDDINPPEPEYDGEWHDAPTVLDRICAGRGWLLAGGKPDIARASALVLDEFRAGLIGKVSIQRPGDQAMDEAPVPVLQAQLDERPDMKKRPAPRKPGPGSPKRPRPSGGSPRAQRGVRRDK
ncbi:MAG: ribosome biogenesis GTPase YlqF [Clostridia bacterium]|nr:ribosome biogenesis GTPase YlqF [Clostridia bacterium]